MNDFEDRVQKLRKAYGIIGDSHKESVSSDSESDEKPVGTEKEDSDLFLNKIFPALFACVMIASFIFFGVILEPFRLPPIIYELLFSLAAMRMAYIYLFRQGKEYGLCFLHL